MAFNLKEVFVMISEFDGQLSLNTEVGWLPVEVKVKFIQCSRIKKDESRGNEMSR